jgi:hypothetical protein
MTAIDLASYAGLAAMTLLTVNVMLGLLMAVKYNPVREWPHRQDATPTNLWRSGPAGATHASAFERAP